MCIYTYHLMSTEVNIIVHSSPTRRSSDLDRARGRTRRAADPAGAATGLVADAPGRPHDRQPGPAADRLHRRAGPDQPDRKSTRLNSSHVKISYAVFCLKKKTLHVKTKSQQ